MSTKELQNLKQSFLKMYSDRLETVLRKRDSEWCKRDIRNGENLIKIMETVHDHIKSLSVLMKRLSKSRDLSPKELALLYVFSYLTMAEGGTCNALNYFSYLLVTMGHDLFSLTKRKYIKDNIEEIRKVEMSTKIQFLNHHGFKALTKEYDSTLRNDIAHFNFRTDEKGIVWIKGKPVDLHSKFDSLIKIMDFTIDIATEMNKRAEDDLAKLQKEVKT